MKPETLRIVKLCLLLALLQSARQARSQQLPVNPALLRTYWAAQWITYPGVAQKAYGVYHFRKKIDLAAVPPRFIVHVSADNRYRLYVNGKSVCFGPARGDLYNWYYETVDLAPYLKQGANTLAAVVWNFAEHAPVAQISNQTGFIMQGDGTAEQLINTGHSWKVIKDEAYQPCSLDNGQRLHTYFVAGPGDHVKAALYPWGWEQADYDDSHWAQADNIASGIPSGSGTDNLWTLSPRTIPLMEETHQRFSTMRRATGLEAGGGFLSGQPLTIDAGKKVSILIDQSFNTLAYPELKVSGGEGAVVKITYAEALFDKKGAKDNRNDIDGKEIAGQYDLFEPDGGRNRVFSPLWQRSFRYVQLDITTAGQPLVIEDFQSRYTGYPFKERARFISNDTTLKEIWNVGWRTARLCAGETYYDCPYYEQLQYEADTRIQSLISLYVTGDDRLMRKAINDFYHSRSPEGLTQGRYPSNRLQIIPPFSLFWVSMLHDYMMYRNDDKFLKQYLMAAQGVLDWFENHIDQKRGMLGPMPWWNFTDWSTGFQAMGVPSGASDGNSAVLSLQYAYTLNQAAELFKHFGQGQQAEHYAKLAASIGQSTYNLCFDKRRMLFGDTPDKKSYSQHASIMGILSGAIPAMERRQVMKNVLSDTSLIQATFYYRFYLVQALKKAGLGNLYYSQLKPWRDMIKNGLTTFAENPDPTRSDCHGWSASPDFDFLATICGINPVSANFKTVEIRPNPGTLFFISGSMPTPYGDISVEVNQKKKTEKVAILQVPRGITGKFLWGGKNYPLRPGYNQIRLP